MDTITDLLKTYTELNSSEIAELFEPPSPLEFMRFVAKNRPLVIRGGAKDWEASKLWTKNYLRDTLGGQMVNVAVTPEGNADSPVTRGDGSILFVQPWEEAQPFSEFIEHVTQQEIDDTLGEVRYAQTQNDNMRGEYATLFQHVERDIPWARIALQTEPEAINLWIGNSKSVTAMHKDNYENIYCQIIGEKHFVLLPPLAFACVQEELLLPAKYVRDNDTMIIEEDKEGVALPVPIWDPDKPKLLSTKYSHLARPIRVTLEAGDMLYLPALWYHKVSQSCSKEGLCCAVNYWYDMSFEGNFFPSCSFARTVAMGVLQDKERK